MAKVVKTDVMRFVRKKRTKGRRNRPDGYSPRKKSKGAGSV